MLTKKSEAGAGLAMSALICAVAVSAAFGADEPPSPPNQAALSGELAVAINFGSLTVTIFERTGDAMKAVQTVKTTAAPGTTFLVSSMAARGLIPT